VQVLFAERRGSGVSLDLVAITDFCWEGVPVASGSLLWIGLDVDANEYDRLAEVVEGWAADTASIALDVWSGRGCEALVLDGPATRLILDFRTA
jgi:hypothetical protein